MTVIFGQVTIHDSIQESVILEIFPSSFLYLPELSFRDPLCVFGIISLGTILCHNICRDLFTTNVLNVYIFVFYHFPQKMLMYIELFGTNTNLPILWLENSSLIVFAYNYWFLHFSHFFEWHSNKLHFLCAFQ